MAKFKSPKEKQPGAGQARSGMPGAISARQPLAGPDERAPFSQSVSIQDRLLRSKVWEHAKAGHWNAAFEAGKKVEDPDLRQELFNYINSLLRFRALESVNKGADNAHWHAAFRYLGIIRDVAVRNALERELDALMTQNPAEAHTKPVSSGDLKAHTKPVSSGDLKLQREIMEFIAADEQNKLRAVQLAGQIRDKKLKEETLELLDAMILLKYAQYADADQINLISNQNLRVFHTIQVCIAHEQFDMALMITSSKLTGVNQLTAMIAIFDASIEVAFDYRTPIVDFYREMSVSLMIFDQIPFSSFRGGANLSIVSLTAAYTACFQGRAHPQEAFEINSRIPVDFRQKIVDAIAEHIQSTLDMFFGCYVDPWGGYAGFDTGNSFEKQFERVDFEHKEISRIKDAELRTAAMSILIKAIRHRVSSVPPNFKTFIYRPSYLFDNLSDAANRYSEALEQKIKEELQESDDS